MSLCLLATCLLALSACGDRRGGAVTVTDSAGVRITVTRGGPPALTALDSVPVLSIGGAEAAGPTQFFRIQNVHVDPQGRLWVADGQSAELRIFEADGSHWKTVGGRGEGPGEFLQIRLLGAVGGDSVLVGDPETGRVTFFDARGGFVRTEPMASSDGVVPRPFDVFEDGSVLGQVPRIVSASSIVPGAVLTDSVELVRMDVENGAPRGYATAAGPLWLWTGRSQVPIPFTLNASFVVVDEAVHLAAGPDFRIRVFEDGRLLESYGVQRPRRGVEARHRQAYRAFVEEHVPEPQREDHLAALDHGRRPDVLPAYDRLLAAPDGRVWAQIYDPDFSAPHGWDVFDDSRRLIGHVRVPPTVYPYAITEDAVVAVWRDELGVEHVRAYRLPDRRRRSPRPVGRARRPQWAQKVPVSSQQPNGQRIHLPSSSTSQRQRTMPGIVMFTG